jgi:putative transposase
MVPRSRSGGGASSLRSSRRKRCASCSRPGKSVHAVAGELDLTETCLRSWVQQAQVDAQPNPQGALTTDEHAELVRLRRELRTVEMERDFLKKRRRTSRSANREVKLVVTTQSRHDHRIEPNLVARQFDVAAPNQVWVSDLTYLRTTTGFVYLAVVIDLSSRRVVGWKVSSDADADVAVEALRRALAVRSAPAGLIHHSDRGVHYACKDYRETLDAHGIQSSMSRKGDSWDNAVAKSFFSTLYFELGDSFIFPSNDLFLGALRPPSSSVGLSPPGCCTKF